MDALGIYQLEDGCTGLIRWIGMSTTSDIGNVSVSPFSLHSFFFMSVLGHCSDCPNVRICRFFSWNDQVLQRVNQSCLSHLCLIFSILEIKEEEQSAWSYIIAHRQATRMFYAHSTLCKCTCDLELNPLQRWQGGNKGVEILGVKLILKQTFIKCLCFQSLSYISSFKSNWFPHLNHFRVL